MVVVLVLAPSPKLQLRLVIVPAEVSVKVTTNGTTPLVGLAVKLACGMSAPVPVTALVELPPLAVVKITAFVKPATDVGVNCTTTLAELPGGRLNEPPERIVNGPPVTVAVPLLIVVPPVLLTVNTPC